MNRALSHKLSFGFMQWVPQPPFTAAISNATYSCDSALVYTGFVDGSVGVFDAESLRPRCRLAPSVHIPQGVSGYVTCTDMKYGLELIQMHMYILALCEILYHV